jgi:protein TonB
VILYLLVAIKMKTLSAISTILLVVSAANPAQQKPACNPCDLRASQRVAETLLVHRVEPEYPKEAIASGIVGNVVVRFVINEQGNTADIFALRSSRELPCIENPKIVDAVIKAVKEWKFKPYLLNGNPKAVETVFTFHVDFAKAAK